MSDLYSECCGAPSTTEIIDGLGICSECREHSGFEEDDYVNESFEWDINKTDTRGDLIKMSPIKMRDF